MDRMSRYAVYFAPRPGVFADRATAWLGWDAAAGLPVDPPDLPDLPDLPLPPTALTVDPRRYGFHATLRAPFRPAHSATKQVVTAAVSALAAEIPPVSCEGLYLANLDGFLALVPIGASYGLMSLAATVVERTDPLRADLTETEIARRRPDRLTPRQRELMMLWGYPFVMDEFRFHLTLTDKLAPDMAATVAAVLRDHFAPVLPRPFLVQDLCLFGEDVEGRFHLLSRHALTG